MEIQRTNLDGSIADILQGFCGSVDTVAEACAEANRVCVKDERGEMYPISEVRGLE